MKKKLLIVNLQNPKDSSYYPCNGSTASWLLDRRLSNYLFFVIDQNGSVERINFPETVDYFIIEKILKNSVGKL